MKIGIVGPKTQVQHIEKMFTNKNVYYNNITDSETSTIKRYINYIRKLKDINVVYTIGVAFRINPRIIIPKLLGKKVISHWIGSDVLMARERKTSKINQMFIDTNIACSPLIKTELQEMGIKSEVVPIIPSGLKFSISKMPQKHAVLVYLPEGKEEFYGLRHLKLLAEKFYSIEFMIVANTNSKLLNLDNVRFLGKLSLKEMEKLYDEISILLRIPEHDGLSLMVLEAMTKGKHVIYKYEFPYTYIAEDEDALISIFTHIVNTPPGVNHEANKYVSENFNENVIYSQWEKVLSKTINKGEE